MPSLFAVALGNPLDHATLTRGEEANRDEGDERQRTDGFMLVLVPAGVLKSSKTRKLDE